MLDYDLAARKCNFIWAIHNTLAIEGIEIPAIQIASIIGAEFQDQWKFENKHDSNGKIDDQELMNRIKDHISTHYFGHPWPHYFDNPYDMEKFVEQLIENHV